MLVVVLVAVLDLLGFSGENGIRFPPNDFVQPQGAALDLGSFRDARLE